MVPKKSFRLEPFAETQFLANWRNLNMDEMVEGFPGSSAGKESVCNVADLGSIPGLGRSPGGGHGNTLQYPCLENPDRQRSLAACSSWGLRVRQDWATRHSTAHRWLKYINTKLSILITVSEIYRKDITCRKHSIIIEGNGMPRQ